MLNRERINNAPVQRVSPLAFEFIDWLGTRDHSDAILACAAVIQCLPSETRHHVLSCAKNMVQHPETVRRGYFAAVRYFIEEDLGLDLED